MKIIFIKFILKKKNTKTNSYLRKPIEFEFLDKYRDVDLQMITNVKKYEQINSIKRNNFKKYIKYHFFS